MTLKELFHFIMTRWEQKNEHEDNEINLSNHLELEF